TAGTLINKPRRASRAFTLDHDFRDFVAQFDWQVEARRRLPAVSEVEWRAADLTPPGVERARLAFPRRAGLGPDQARRQSAGFVLDAGDGARAASIRRNLDGSAQGGEPGCEAARAAEFDAVADPQNVGRRFAREKMLDRRDRVHTGRLVRCRRQRTQAAFHVASV